LKYIDPSGHNDYDITGMIAAQTGQQGPPQLTRLSDYDYDEYLRYVRAGYTMTYSTWEKNCQTDQAMNDIWNGTGLGVLNFFLGLVDPIGTGHAIGWAITHPGQAWDAFCDQVSTLEGQSEFVTELGLSALMPKVVKAPKLPKVSTIDEVFKNPSLLVNMTPDEISAIAQAEGKWTIGTLGQGAHEGQGLTIRYKDQFIEWHPGDGHHGPEPYWKVSSGQTGTVRIGPQFPYGPFIP
jgi:hypothetical protein